MTIPRQPLWHAPDDARPNVGEQHEREVLTLLAEGVTDESIAGPLFPSPLAVPSHTERIVRKLGGAAVGGVSLCSAPSR